MRRDTAPRGAISEPAAPAPRRTRRLAAALTLAAARQAGEPTLRLLDKIRTLAKSATELASRGVNEAAEFLHKQLWDGAPRVAQRAARAASPPPQR